MVTNKLLRKKINLLIHLAQMDGKFDTAEKDFLRTVLVENGLDASSLEEHVGVSVNLKDIAEAPRKSELLYWVLKLIHADGQLHPAELEYSKAIAKQLGFRADVIEHYRTNPINTLAYFENDIKTFEVK